MTIKKTIDFSSLLKTLRVLDADGTVSLTALAFVGAGVVYVVAPGWVTLAGWALATASYAHRRHTHRPLDLAGKVESLAADVARLKNRVG